MTLHQQGLNHLDSTVCEGINGIFSPILQRIQSETIYKYSKNDSIIFKAQ